MIRFSRIPTVVVAALAAALALFTLPGFAQQPVRLVEDSITGPQGITEPVSVAPPADDGPSARVACALLESYRPEVDERNETGNLHCSHSR